MKVGPSSADIHRQRQRPARKWHSLRIHEEHGYLSGNYAPVESETPLTRCAVVHGEVPADLRGGQYVRNGGNPMSNANLRRESHWFDGDGEWMDADSAEIVLPFQVH